MDDQRDMIKLREFDLSLCDADIAAAYKEYGILNRNCLHGKPRVKLDTVVVDWISDFIYFCCSEDRGISPHESAEIIYLVIKGYQKSCSQGLPYHFPNPEALASMFDFEPNQTVQNDGDGDYL